MISFEFHLEKRHDKTILSLWRTALGMTFSFLARRTEKDIIYNSFLFS